ncbi:Hep/Hag repeat protein, partial [Fusobacterium equinum]
MISKNTILKNLEKYLKRSFKGKVRINESSLIAYLLVGGFFCFVSNVGYATVAGKGEIKYQNNGSKTEDGLAINFAKALGNSQTIAIGGNDDDGGNGNAIAKGEGSIAIGGKSRTEGSNAVAVGVEAAANEGATALGAKSKSLGTNSIALGLEAEAKQNESIAIGHAAKADELHAISMGDQANTKSQNGISIGAGAVADGQSSIVIGKGSKISELTDAAGRPKNRDAAVVIGVDSVSKNQYTITMGHRAETLGQDSFAFGNESKARKDRAIAFGERTIADGENSMALGSKAGAYTVNTLAFGAGAQAKESQAISIGNKAHSNGENSISIGTTSLVGKVGQYGMSTGEKIVKNGTAIGGYSNVDANGGTTIGSFTTVNNEGGVALGIDSIANVAGGKAGAKQTYSAYNSEKAGAFTSTNTYNGNMRTGVAPRNNLKAGAVSVGKADGSFTRQIVGLAAGTEDTDAVNVAQLKSLTMKIEGDKNENEGETPKVGLWNGSLKVTAKGTGSIKASTVVKGNEVTVNVDSTDLEKKIQAAGKVKYFSVKSTGGNNENNDGATADNAVAIGKNSSATEENSIALGSDATTANAKKEVTQAEVQAGNGDKVVYNGFAGTKPYAQLSVGSKDKERQIKNVAAGEVSASSTDAVNGSQLYAVAAKPMTYTDDKGTQINRLLGQNINLKGGAQGDLSTGNIAVEASGTDTLNIKLAKNLKEIDSISKNGKAGSPKITLGDSNISFNSDVDMGSKKITNVAAGDVSENSTDAVNGSQLDKVAKESKTEVKAGDSGNVTVNKSDDTTDKHPVYTVDMKKNITLHKVTVTNEKKDKKTEVTPGRVSVNGKNGSGVTLNGADGSIGLKGENGKDALSIKGEKGQAGVDGKNGTDGKTRIVYEYWDPKNPKIAVREEVATLNDGIKYKGDSGEAYTKLNKQTEIVGGQKDTDKLSENNIGVVASQEG